MNLIALISLLNIETIIHCDQLEITPTAGLGLSPAQRPTQFLV